MYYENFDYDKNGNKVYIDKNGEVTRYKYDGMNRLTRAWNDNTYTEYEFDNFNNISKEYELYGNSIETKSYYYDNANHLLLQDGKETVQYEYDNAGNLVKKITGIGSNAETAYYSYDGYNRLSGYADSDTVSEYTYNLDGLRESKTVNNIKTRYVYDGANILGEITEENTYTYTRGTELIGYTSNSGDRLYYVQDGHGNVTALLNEDGTEKKTYNYNPYGKEEDTIIYPMGSKTAIMLWRLQTETPHNPFRYCGEYYDDETDLIYLRNRYYDNQTGRFIMEDTHWNPSNMIYGDEEYKDEELKIPDINAIMQSDNLYAYCINNPIYYADINGEKVYIIGSQVAAQIGLRLGASKGIVADEHNNVGLIAEGSFGGGLDVGVNVGGFLAIIDTEYISDVGGGSFEIGGSVSPIKVGPFSVGSGYDFTVSLGENKKYGKIYSINAGVGVLPADGHGQLSYTITYSKWYTKIASLILKAIR